MTTTGLTLVPQKSGGVYVGSYAGATVPFGVRPSNDSVSGSGYTGPGFHWLKNVDKATNPASAFSAEWDITDTWNALPVPMDVRLRLTMLGSYNDVSLADGIPPQNKPGNPASIRYLIAHRTGTNLDSLFTSVIAAYNAANLVGRYIYINNDGVRNAVYKILGTSGQNGSNITLNIGDVTPIRSYKDSNDFAKGFNFDFANGATFTIPLSSEIIQ